MLLHVVKGLEVFGFKMFSELFHFKEFENLMFIHLEHILSELTWSRHVAGAHSTNVIP